MLFFFFWWAVFFLCHVNLYNFGNLIQIGIGIIIAHFPLVWQYLIGLGCLLQESPPTLLPRHENNTRDCYCMLLICSCSFFIVSYYHWFCGRPLIRFCLFFFCKCWRCSVLANTTVVLHFFFHLLLMAYWYLNGTSNVLDFCLHPSTGQYLLIKCACFASF